LTHLDEGLRKRYLKHMQDGKELDQMESKLDELIDKLQL
jgi:hypothetical protein